MGKDEIKCGDRVFVTKSDGINPSRSIDMFRRQSSLVTNIKDGIASLYIIDQYGANHYAKAPIENLVKAKESLKANTGEDRYARYREGKWNFISQEDFVKEINPEEHKIDLPLPEDAKWEAIGRGYASVLMEKQARIDRLERLIWWIRENICMGVESNVLEDNDLETSFCVEILKKFEELKNK